MERNAMSILVVEDDLVTMKILDLNLRKHGLDTVLKETGSDALDYMSSNQDVELVVLDVMMPEMDGLQVVSKMREKPELKDIPVIMCTALSDTETVRKAASLGVVDYVVKPVNAGVLLEKIRKALGIKSD
jgi:CheY-like chemotaxis protein